jgi:hypothetical protein
MNSSVKNMLSELVCTGLNSILYADGAMILFNVGFDENRRRFIAPIVDAHVESFLKYNSEDLAPFDIFAKSSWKNLNIYVGDSSAEGSGVIYVTEANRGDLIWFLCFENSEAFFNCLSIRSCVRDD